MMQSLFCITNTMRIHTKIHVIENSWIQITN